MSQAGSLTIVGTGITLLGHMTQDALAYIRGCDRLLYLVTSTLTEEWLREQNPRAESLADCYAEGKSRMQSYDEMVERMLTPMRQGETVCTAFYGHPGVFVLPSHRAVRQAREAGYAARMLPGISAEDCLFADLGVDPGPVGCQSFEATDFLLRHRPFDATSALVLWQVGCIGDGTFRRDGYDLAPLGVLVEVLREAYPPGHPVTAYQAAVYPGCDPVMATVPLEDLPQAPVTAGTTLFVPPLGKRPLDQEMARRLGLQIPAATLVHSGPRARPQNRAAIV